MGTTTIPPNRGSGAPAVLSRRCALGLLGTAASAAAAGFLPSSALAADDDPPASPRRVPARAGGSPAPLPQSRAEAHLDIISPALLQEQAKTAMSAGAYEYVHGAAGDGWTAGQNIGRLRTLTLVPRRLAGFAQADTASALFGRNVKAPLYVCPMGAQDIVHADAELATARGGRRGGGALHAYQRFQPFVGRGQPSRPAGPLPAVRHLPQRGRSGEPFAGRAGGRGPRATGQSCSRWIRSVPGRASATGRWARPGPPGRGSATSTRPGTGRVSS